MCRLTSFIYLFYISFMKELLAQNVNIFLVHTPSQKVSANLKNNEPSLPILYMGMKIFPFLCQCWAISFFVFPSMISQNSFLIIVLICILLTTQKVTFSCLHKVINAHVKILKCSESKKWKLKVPFPAFLSLSVLFQVVSTIKTFFCILLGKEKHGYQHFICILFFYITKVDYIRFAVLHLLKNY